MASVMEWLVGSLGCIVVAAANQTGGPSNPRKSQAQPGLEVIAGYRNWTAVNKKRYRMPPALAALCRVVSPDEIGKKGRGPHADKYIRVYVNAAGRGAMFAREHRRFPVGSMIVKEKLADEKSDTAELLTVMIKREKGYNPKHGDWEYAVFDGAGKQVQVRGRLQNCQSCHAKQRKQEFVFRTYLTYQNKKAYRLLTAGARSVARR